MKTYRRLVNILKRTGALKMFLSFIVVCLIASVILKYVESSINSIPEGLLYCFVAATTIGFGDICATSVIGRIVTIIVVFNGIFVFAIMTGVVVSYYMEYLHNKKNETLSMFFEKLENLPNLSKEELENISKRIKKIK